MKMLKPPNPIRLLLALAALAAIALAASGCGTSTADEQHGRVLFVQKCGVCHTMAEAGTTAQIGPNLDDAFAAARAAGEGGDTIEGIVKAQVEFPRPSTDNPDNSMPADVVTGQDLEDVAAYVGRYAGVPGAAPPKVPGGPGAQVFANNGCGGCHTLAAAQSGGVTGPNLDEVLPGQQRHDGRRIDRRPEREDRQGLPGKRDAAELRRNAVQERTRRPRPVPAAGNAVGRQRQKGRLSRPRPGPGR